MVTTALSRDETPFAWEKMYAFKYTGARGAVEKAIGTKVDRVTELQRRLVFTKDSRVVFYEEETTDGVRILPPSIAIPCNRLTPFSSRL